MRVLKKNFTHTLRRKFSNQAISLIRIEEGYRLGLFQCIFGTLLANDEPSPHAMTSEGG
jgi:hypothetical protein